MSTLGFKCAYITAKDVERTSPCGRPVAPRKRGEPRCLGHWVIEWLAAAYGGDSPERARSAYGPFCAILAVVMFASGIQSATGLAGNHRNYSAIETALSFVLAGAFGGIALGFTLEHPLGGRLWLALAPIVSMALLLEGRSYLVHTAPSSGSRLTGIAEAFVDFMLALVWLASWLIFLMQSTGRYRLATCLNIFCEVIFVAVVLSGIGLALASHGADSALLMMLVVAIGLATVVRGVSRLKKLAKKIRVG